MPALLTTICTSSSSAAAAATPAASVTSKATGHEARVGDRRGVAHRGVDLRRAAREELLGDGLADAAVGAGDECDGTLDLHDVLLRNWMTTVIHRIRMTSIIQTVGHSQDEKKANHERIVEIAAARMRESGTEAPGVAEIMRAAGLTHGGFYKHFDSRDELVAEAAERAFDASARRTADALRGRRGPAGGVRRLLPLRRRTATTPRSGCAVAGLGPDAARGDERIRARFEAGVQSYLARLEDMLGSRDDAVVALSSMVGALLLARAVDDPELSDELLAGVRERVVTAR